MTENELLWFWGKTDRESTDIGERMVRYHPLLFHLLDVGHAALALWDEVLSEITQKRIAQALGCDVEQARLVFAYLAAVHDLGKASPVFQFQKTELVWIKARLESAGLVCPSGLKCENRPHSYISTKELRKLWQKQKIAFWKAKDDGEKLLSYITGAHHGTIPTSVSYVGWYEETVGNAAWAEARLELLEALKTALCSQEWEAPPTEKWDDLGSVPLLAGLISVADWIGSSKNFPLAGHRDGTGMPTLAQYVPLSRQRASEALAEFGWTQTPSPTLPRLDFNQFWNFQPNTLQKVIDTQTRDVNAPFLLIVEGPMGIGKTEGALWATDAALSAQINSGFYIALPTQATSNAMHIRVKEFLKERLFDTQNLHLQLVHGNAALSNDVKIVFNGLTDLFNEKKDNDKKDDKNETIMALSWFCGPKRPLLAPFGVGTIDQSLMATLQTKHWFVRLFGLAGKVVIFDEVHAYDTYMSELLNSLLSWLKELSCSVILLSATLPKSKRTELLKAWGVQPAPQEAQYPRVTWCSSTQTTALSLPVSADSLDKKNVIIEKRRPNDLAEALKTKLANGGCAVIICNTVAEAQDLFQNLKTELGDFVEADNWILFHARMPFGWRQRIETKILDKFGKRKANRPKRAIVVATQVIEQSLDLDFDYLASFMAPTDLLLQRIGRLHRHQIDEKKKKIVRPKGLEIPMFTLLCNVPEDKQTPSFGDSEFVYEREILLRSWLLWRDKEQLELPKEIESLIEATYCEEQPELDAVWEAALKEAKEEATRTKKTAQNTAEKVLIKTHKNGKLKKPHHFIKEASLDLKDPDDPNIHEAIKASTRDGKPSVTAICLCQVGNRIYLPNDAGEPNGNEEVDLEAEPDRDMVRKLMDFAVPLSKPEIFTALVAEPVPKSWKKVPLLRHTRCLAFTQGRTEVGKTTIRLDGELGLVIGKSDTVQKENGAD